MMIVTSEGQHLASMKLFNGCGNDPYGKRDLSMTLWQHLVREGTVLVWWADVILHQICKDFNGLFSQIHQSPLQGLP